MAALIKNKTANPITLPFPMKGVLKGGQAIVLDTNAATVIAGIGESPGVLDIRDITQTDNFDEEFEGQLLTPGIDSDEIEDEAVTTDKIADEAVATGKIADEAVAGSKILDGIFRTELVAGVDETMTPSIAVTGLAAGDELVEVLVFDPTGPSSFAQRALADFTVGAAALAVVGNAADNTGHQYHIRWVDKTV